MREFKPILGIDEISKSRLINVFVLTQDGKETPITLSAADQVKIIKEKLLGDAAAKDLPSFKVSVIFVLFFNRQVPSVQQKVIHTLTNLHLSAADLFKYA